MNAAIRKMTQDLPGEPMDNLQAAPDWAACRDQTLLFFNAANHPDEALWRLSVPQTAPALNLPWAQLMEWHGGLRWVWAPESALHKLRDLTQAVDGFTTLFRAASAGGIRAAGHFEPLEKPIDQIHARLKAEFDPAHIFNPGRMLSSL